MSLSITTLLSSTRSFIMILTVIFGIKMLVIALFFAFLYDNIRHFTKYTLGYRISLCFQCNFILSAFVTLIL